MGFLSFLSRNSSSHDNKSIKSQAYHATVAALPPVRGSYPLPGNLSSDILQKTGRKFSSSQASTGSEQWAPPPGFHRPRSTSDVRRSAARLEGDAELPPRPKSAGRNSRYMNGNGPPYLLSHPLRQSATQDASDPVPPIPSFVGRGRKVGYVDILDAQSDLKPSNFRARVLAAGVRDYGEDVAERNIGGGVLQSGRTTPVAQEFATGMTPRTFSVTPKATTSNRQREATYRASAAVSDDSDESAPAPIVATGDKARKKPAIRRRRSQRLDKKSGPTSPNIVSSRASSLARVIRSAPNGNQTSLVTIETGSRHRRSKTSDMDDQLASRRLSISTLPSNATKTRPKPRPLSLNPTISGMTYDGVAPPPAVPRYKHHMPSSQDPSRAKPDTKTSMGTTRAQRRASAVGTISNLVSKVNTESHLWESSSDDERPYFPPQSLPTSRPASRGKSTGNYRHAVQDQTLHFPSNTALFEFERSRPGTRSLGGMNHPKHPQLYDISEHIPTRSSSLAPNSSSATLTTIMSNEHSSYAAFTRPQSQHTTATSVELYSGKSASDTSPSLKSGSRPPSSAYYTAVEELGASGSRQLARISKSLFGDAQDQGFQTSQLQSYNYAATDSSDADSFVSLAQRKRLDDEALLFRTSGYGGPGNYLPGLSDMLDGFDMDKPDWERHLTIPTAHDWYIGTGLRSPDVEKRLRIPFLGAGSEVETASVGESSINDAEFVSDVGEEQAKPIKHMRVSALGGLSPKLVGNASDSGRLYDRGVGAQDSIRAGDERMDVGATMKLRKEMKRHQRSHERSQSRGRVGAVEDAGRGKEPI